MATVLTPTPAETSINLPADRVVVQHPPRPWLKWITLALVIVGTLDTVYLAYSHAFGVATVCPAVSSAFKCDLVQNSIYSTLAGIPISYLGLIGYVALLIALLLDGRVTFFTRYGATIAFGLSLFGFLYSGYLTSIEAFVLHAWCAWCLGSAILMTGIFSLSAVRAWRTIGAGALVDDDEDFAEEA